MATVVILAGFGAVLLAHNPNRTLRITSTVLAIVSVGTYVGSMLVLLAALCCADRCAMACWWCRSNENDDDADDYDSNDDGYSFTALSSSPRPPPALAPFPVEDEEV